MKWFKHFSNAHDNNDLTKVRMKYGADGYAIYWYCLELVSGDLGTSETVTFELKHDAEVIGFNLRIDTNRVEEIMTFMVTLGLFENSHGVVSCLKLAKYLDKKTTRNNQIHKIIDSATEQLTLSETVPDSPPTNTDESGRSPLDTDTDTDINICQELKIPVCPHKKIIGLYHEILPELNRVILNTWPGSTRANHLQARWRSNKNYQDLEFWRWYFQSVKTSAWHMGENPSGWKADLGFLVTKSKFESLVEKFANA